MDNTQTNIPPFGDLHYYRKERQWMGNAAGIDPERPIELALAVDNETQPLDEKADILRRFAAGYPAVADLIYARIYERFDERGMGKPLDKLRDMYHLIALTLQNDNETVWVTMEPKRCARCVTQEVTTTFKMRRVALCSECPRKRLRTALLMKFCH